MVERKRPQRADVRRQVLDAALKVFAERGFDRSSMEDVALAAGFTKGALYSNFAGKDALFLALMERQVGARLELVDEVRGMGPLSSREIGRLLTRAALRDQEWQLLFLDYWARAVRDPEVRTGFREHRRRLHRHIAEVVELILGSSSRADLPPDQLATLVLALSNGIAIEGLVDSDELPEDLFGEVLAAIGLGS